MKKSNVKILVSQTAEFDRTKGQSVMENLIQKYPNFDAVFGANDEMIIGAVEAMSAAKLKKVQSALQRIESGDYGYCEETGDAIGLPRLLARLGHQGQLPH